VKVLTPTSAIRKYVGILENLRAGTSTRKRVQCKDLGLIEAHGFLDSIPKCGQVSIMP